MFNKMIDMLRANLGCWSRIAAGGSELLTRCRYCEDSKDPNNGHFYIKIIPNSPLAFHCKKCGGGEKGTGGILTSKIAMEWGIYDEELLHLIDQYNAHIKVSNKNSAYSPREIPKYNLKISDSVDHNLAQKKLDYINERLQLNLTLKDCEDLRLVLNIGDFLEHNRITHYQLRDSSMLDLHRHFVGFLSFDRAFVILRNIGTLPKDTPFLGGLRYMNYNIFGKRDDGDNNALYIKPTQVNILKPIEVNITEGVFDTLSVLYNIHNGGHENAIYAMETGNSYRRILNHLIGDCGFMNLKVNFFPDNDVTDQKIYRIADHYRPFCKEIHIFRNVKPGQKDCGVKPSDILLREF